MRDRSPRKTWAQSRTMRKIVSSLGSDGDDPPVASKEERAFREFVQRRSSKSLENNWSKGTSVRLHNTRPNACVTDQVETSPKSAVAEEDVPAHAESTPNCTEPAILAHQVRHLCPTPGRFAYGRLQCCGPVSCPGCTQSCLPVLYPCTVPRHCTLESRCIQPGG